METIRYVVGDATHPEGPGRHLIVHVCNDVGTWGAGFTAALSQRWRGPEQEYRKRYVLGGARLGMVQFVEVAPTIAVINMVAQHGLPSPGAPPPIRYDALALCLGSVQALTVFCSEEGQKNPEDRNLVTVHMPRIGCGLAGGKWDEVEPIILAELVAHGVPVTVYDLSPGGGSSPF